MSKAPADAVMHEFLSDPLGDRKIDSVALPPKLSMSKEFLFPRKEKVNIEALKTHLKREGQLSQDAVLELLHRTTDILSTETNILRIKDPVTVVGDIHGQFYDMLKLLDLGGDPGGKTQYLFLGDFVDRGSYSVEVCLLLFAYKIAHPKRIWLCRGNHECRQMTAFFNFRDECEYKFDDAGLYDAFMHTFDALPLGAIINGKFLALHGGLSPNWVEIKDADAIDRIAEPPREGLFCDMLWSDPCGEEQTKGTRKGKFLKNDVRGCAWFFSFQATCDFLSKNSLLSVIRAHEAQLEGYKMHTTNESTGFPSVITIFSAPNYCDVYGNKGAILKFNNDAMNILQFHVSPHPYYLPNFMGAFSWSMPFMVEKVTEMLYSILQHSANETDEDIDNVELPDCNKILRKSLSFEENHAVSLAQELARRLDTKAPRVLEKGSSDRIRTKVRAIGKLAQVFKTIRLEHESMIKLRGMCPADGISPEKLLVGSIGTESSPVDQFSHIQSLDQDNEKLPACSRKQSPKSLDKK